LFDIHFFNFEPGSNKGDCTLGAHLVCEIVTHLYMGHKGWDIDDLILGAFSLMNFADRAIVLLVVVIVARGGIQEGARRLILFVCEIA
jgi:hypothetical protein